MVGSCRVNTKLNRIHRGPYSTMKLYSLVAASFFQFTYIELEIRGEVFIVCLLNSNSFLFDLISFDFIHVRSHLQLLHSCIHADTHWQLLNLSLSLRLSLARSLTHPHFLSTSMQDFNPEEDSYSHPAGPPSPSSVLACSLKARLRPPPSSCLELNCVKPWVS